MRRRAFVMAVAVALCGVLLAAGAGQRTAHAQGEGEKAAVKAKPGTANEAFLELFTMSQEEGKGLVFYAGGQTIPGVVTRVIGDDAVQVKNREHSRIVLRLDRIDAVAAN